ncbi:MAG: hypothetical protein ACM31O_08665 [Bacteroidota bacterium]
MRSGFLFWMPGVLCLLSAVTGTAALAASSVTVQRDGAVQIAGRSLKCGSVRNRLDPRLPNLGMAGPGVLTLNPGLLARYSETVRLFVYHHECGHHHVGGDELRADCWAVNRGLRDGWLNRGALGQICRSFGNDPETETHPSGQRRCRSLERCFAVAEAALAKQRRVAGTAPARSAGSPPALLFGPKLVRVGATERAKASAAR